MSQIISCSHPTQTGIDCEFCTDSHPIYDCPYLEVDNFNDDYHNEYY